MNPYIDELARGQRALDLLADFAAACVRYQATPRNDNDREFRECSRLRDEIDAFGAAELKRRLQAQTDADAALQEQTLDEWPVVLTAEAKS
jgi:hypothetical protein